MKFTNKFLKKKDLKKNDDAKRRRSKIQNYAALSSVLLMIIVR